MRENKKRIYLDFASTTPVDKRVLKEMLPFFDKKFGNTASSHFFGQEVREVLEKCREEIAEILGAEKEEIFFTSSATESNNTVLKGVALALKNKGNHIIISSIEHSSVRNPALWLRKFGFKITQLPVDKYGTVSPKVLLKNITQKTILVSIIHASNEIGTIQPIPELGKICKEKGILFHTDAAQSFGKIPFKIKDLNVDFLTASSHKIYGPKGAALLYKRKGLEIESLLHGGGHEMGFRSSTVNVPAIVGFVKAAQICQKEMKKESKKLIKLRDKLIKKVLKEIPKSYLTGHPKKRLPNHASFYFEGVEGEALAVDLDLKGFAVSTGSACASGKLEPSEVLLALGLGPEKAHGSLRISLGRWTTEKDIDEFLKALKESIKRLRKISGFKL